MTKKKRIFLRLAFKHQNDYIYRNIENGGMNEKIRLDVNNFIFNCLW